MTDRHLSPLIQVRHAFSAIVRRERSCPDDPSDDEHRNVVLPPFVSARVSVEAASPFGWGRHVAPTGAIIGVDHFGASAPGPVVMAHYGFTVEHVVAIAKVVLANNRMHGHTSSG